MTLSSTSVCVGAYHCRVIIDLGAVPAGGEQQTARLVRLAASKKACA